MPSIQVVSTAVMVSLLLGTTGVTLAILATRFDASLDAMTHTMRATSLRLVDSLLQERVALTVSRINNEFIAPPVAMVDTGVHISQTQGIDFSSQQSIFTLTRSLLSSIAGSPFLEEAWVLRYKGGELLHGTKGVVRGRDDPFTIKWLNTSNNSMISYTDRLPLPGDGDITLYQEVGRSQRFIDDEFLDAEGEVARAWTVPSTDPGGLLEIGYGVPLYPGVPAFENVWIFTEFVTSFIRPLLQGMVNGSEHYSELTYDDPAYVPVTNDSVLCLADVVSGLLVECSHGYGAVLTERGSTSDDENKWTREVASESPHPVVGPAFALLVSSFGSLQDVDHTQLMEFESEGTQRFPIPPKRFFLRSAPVTHPGGLNWLAVAVTPYDSIMQQVDHDANQANQDAHQATIVSVVTATVITCCALGIVIAYTMMFTRPLAALLQDMQSVETMDLDAVQHHMHTTRSFFTEINEMHSSFVQMITMLVQYRRFLPTHLVNGGTTDEDSAQGSVRPKSGISDHTAASRHTAGNTNAAHIFALELTDRTQCTVLRIQFPTDGGYTRMEAQNTFNDTLEAISRITGLMRVRPYTTVLQTSVELVFNTAASCPCHSLKAVTLAMHLKNDPALQGIALRMGVSSGRAVSGNVGSAQQRWHLVTGAPLTKVDAMLQYVRDHRVSGVVCDDQVASYCNTFQFRRVHQLCIKQSDDMFLSFGMFVLVKEHAGLNEEWMYSIERSENDPTSAANSAFESLLQGNFDAAKATLQQRCHTADTHDQAQLIQALMASHPDMDGCKGWLSGISATPTYGLVLSKSPE